MKYDSYKQVFVMILFVHKTETKAIQPPEKPTKPEPTTA